MYIEQWTRNNRHYIIMVEKSIDLLIDLFPIVQVVKDERDVIWVRLINSLVFLIRSHFQSPYQYHCSCSQIQTRLRDYHY